MIFIRNPSEDYESNNSKILSIKFEIIVVIAEDIIEMIVATFVAISRTDLLIIDATVITGILVLLTISIVSSPELTGEIVGFLEFYSKAIILIAIMPFVISARIEIDNELKFSKGDDTASREGLKWMRRGFILIAPIIAVVFTIQFFISFGVFSVRNLV